MNFNKKLIYDYNKTLIYIRNVKRSGTRKNFGLLYFGQVIQEEKRFFFVLVLFDAHTRTK